jgi:hypothetical protein
VPASVTSTFIGTDAREGQFSFVEIAEQVEFARQQELKQASSLSAGRAPNGADGRVEGD